MKLFRHPYVGCIWRDRLTDHHVTHIVSLVRPSCRPSQNFPSLRQDVSKWNALPTSGTLVQLCVTVFRIHHGWLCTHNMFDFLSVGMVLRCHGWCCNTREHVGHTTTTAILWEERNKHKLLWKYERDVTTGTLIICFFSKFIPRSERAGGSGTCLPPF